MSGRKCRARVKGLTSIHTGRLSGICVPRTSVCVCAVGVKTVHGGRRRPRPVHRPVMEGLEAAAAESQQLSGAARLIGPSVVRSVRLHAEPTRPGRPNTELSGRPVVRTQKKRTVVHENNNLPPTTPVLSLFPAEAD